MSSITSVMMIAFMCAPVVIILWLARLAPRFNAEWQMLAVGAIVVLASLYPYWVFGPASAVGWYDEYDAVIPSYLLRVASASPFDFSHSFAGGTQVNAVLPDVGNGFFDLYRHLLEWVGPALGSLVYRYLGMLLLYVGLVLTARRLLGTSVVAAGIAGLIGVFATAYPYAWILGGYAWNWALMVWAPLLLFSDARPLPRLFLALAYGAIAALTVTIGFFIPCAVIYCALITVLLRRPIVETLWRNLPALTLIGVLLLLNNVPTISMLVGSWGQSSRFLRVTSPDALAALFGGPPLPRPPLADGLWAAWQAFSLTLLNGLDVLTGTRRWLSFPFTVVFTFAAAAAAIYLTIRRRSAIYIVALLAPIGAIAFLVFIADAFRLPVISSYRWDVLYLGLPFVFSLLLAMFLDDTFRRGWPGRMVSGLTAFLLLATVLVSAGGMAKRAMDDLDAAGGWATLEHYSELSGLADRQPLTRAASMPAYQPKPYLGPNYGLDVIDGVKRNFTWRRVAFWFETLPVTPRPSWHTHRHVLPGRSIDEVDLDALKLTNTGLILSFRQLESSELGPVETVEGLRLRNLPGAYFRLLAALLPDISLAPSLYVYRLGGAWDRAFVPAALRPASANDVDLDYFRQLKTLGRHDVLVPRNAPGWLAQAAGGALVVSRIEKTAHGMDVTTSGEGGLIVYNQEYTPDWRAECGGADLPLAAINAMQMVAQVPQGCSHVAFVHGQ